MLFGATPFANSPFADPGGVTVFVSLTGNRVNVSTGTVGISASARVLPGGSEIEISVGNVVVKIGQTVGVTGVRINLATGTWVPIDPDNP